MKRSMSEMKGVSSTSSNIKRVKNSMGPDTRFNNWPSALGSDDSKYNIYATNEKLHDEDLMAISQDDWQSVGAALHADEEDAIYVADHQFSSQGDANQAEKQTAATMMKIMLMMNHECLQYFKAEYFTYVRNLFNNNHSGSSHLIMSFDNFVTVNLDNIASFSGFKKPAAYVSSSSDSDQLGDTSFDFSIQNWQRRVDTKPAVVAFDSSFDTYNSLPLHHQNNVDDNMLVMNSENIDEIFVSSSETFHVLDDVEACTIDDSKDLSFCAGDDWQPIFSF